MSSPRTNVSGPDQSHWSFIIGALALLVLARGVLWHYEFDLGFTSASLQLVLLGALFGFTIPWLVVSGIGCAIAQLSERNPPYPRHLQFYLEASLWMAVYHMLVLWVRTVAEYRVPIWIGWVAQPTLYALIVLHHLRRRR